MLSHIPVIFGGLECRVSSMSFDFCESFAVFPICAFAGHICLAKILKRGSSFSTTVFSYVWFLCRFVADRFSRHFGVLSRWLEECVIKLNMSSRNQTISQPEQLKK